MRTQRLPYFLPVLAAVWLSACQKSANVAEAEGVPPAAAVKGDPDTVEIPGGMTANLKFETARQESIPRVLTATGKIQFNEDQTARVLAPLPGQVLDLSVRVGDLVEKDAVLFEIKSREVAGMVTDLMQAQRDQALAEKSYAMTKDLFEHQAAARIALQQAEGELAKAKAQAARSAESLRVLGLDPEKVLASSGVSSLIPVRAPLGGTVIERPVTPNQFVQADNTPLITIVDMSTVWVMVDVFETDLHLIRPGQRVVVTASAYPERRFVAEVDRIADKVDAETRTIKVRLRVANPGLALKPEMFIAASVVLAESTSALTVPDKAVFTEGEKSYAYVALDGGRLQRRLLSAAPAAAGDGRRFVTAGLRPGDRVVTDGALLVRLRQKQLEQPQ